MKTETSLKTAKNRGLRSFCGPVRSFDFWEKGRPVTVMVKALWHQKTGPDRTFKHQGEQEVGHVKGKVPSPKISKFIHSVCHVIDSHTHITTPLLISAQENTAFTALILIRKLSSDGRSTRECYHLKYIVQ